MGKDQDLYLEELDETVSALDSTKIDLSLSVFPWAAFQRNKPAVKLHTLLDLRGNIPTFIYISDGKLKDVEALDLLHLEAGAYYAVDKAYLGFERLYAINQLLAFFLTRAKTKLQQERRYFRPVSKEAGL